MDTNVQTMKLNGYTIKANTDFDGHLTLTIDHEDGSTVNDTEMDCAVNETQWAGRFTTEKIEDESAEGDLFEHYDKQPSDLKAILAKYAESDETYTTCKSLLAEVEAIGFTFDYGLDAAPHNLRKIELTQSP